jgi:shikimate dehydrogenase
MTGPRPITQLTQLCGIVLHPADHTRSPAMHNAAFAELGIDAAYLAFDVPPRDLPSAMSGMRAMGIHQLAVSIPHKEAAMALVDELDETAREIGAVNTVTRRDDRLIGSNTDWLGGVRALERFVDLAAARVVVLGAGGTARALVFGMLQRGAEVAVLNRTVARAAKLADELGAQTAGALSDLAKTPYEILINTTSVGLRSDLSPIEASWITPEATVMDAVYDPQQTRLLRDAAARGARTIGGKWMLVYQAAEQFRLWTGKDAPIETMAAAFDAAGTAIRR